MVSPADIPPSQRLFWGLVIALVVVGGLLTMGIFLFSPGMMGSSRLLPVSLRSPLRADYSVDERALQLAQVDIDLVAEAARDEIAAEQDEAETLGDIPSDTMPQLLLTPVPLATETRPVIVIEPTQEIVHTSVPPATHTAVIEPSATIPASTATLPSVATRTSRPTRTLYPSPTSTPIPGMTVTSTFASLPTVTRTIDVWATATIRPLLTDTPEPISTNLFSSTPGKKPTHTPKPPRRTEMPTITLDFSRLTPIPYP